MMNDGIFGIARREQRLERGAPLQRFVDQQTAVHGARHDHVGEQQIDIGGAVDHLQGFGGIAGLQRGVAEAADLRQHIFAHQRVVLDHQHRFVAALHRRGWQHLGRAVIHSGGARQIELHAGAVALLAVDLDVPVGLLDEAVDHAETKAGSLADFLGGEERIEHPFQVLGRNSGAGVAHRDHDIGSRRDLDIHVRIGLIEIDVLGLDREAAAVRHGVARIQRQIENGGGELVRIDQRRPGIVGQQRIDLDLLAERRAQQLHRFEHQTVDVDLARLQRLFARKGQQMFGQLAAAFGGLVDHPGDGFEFGAIGDGLGQDSDGPGDDGQNVVEVVRDAAGQLADRFHLLGLAVLRLRSLLLRQVTADEEMPPHRLRPCSHPGQRHRTSVLVDVARLEVAHLPAAPRRLASRRGCGRDRRDG